MGNLTDWDSQMLKDELVSMALEQHAHAMRPSTQYKPTVYFDHLEKRWYALLGNDDRGVVGHGDSPEAAMTSFDEAWRSKGEPK